MEQASLQSKNFPTLISKSSSLPSLVQLLLTINSILSIYWARNDPWMVAFVVFAYLNLVALFRCLQAFEKLQSIGADEEEKKRLKVVVWALATTLNFTFAYRVAEAMPWAMSVAIGIMSGFVAGVGFYALFIHREPNKADSSNHLHLKTTQSSQLTNRRRRDGRKHNKKVLRSPMGTRTSRRKRRRRRRGRRKRRRRRGRRDTRLKILKKKNLARRREGKKAAQKNLKKKNPHPDAFFSVEKITMPTL